MRVEVLGRDLVVTVPAAGEFSGAESGEEELTRGENALLGVAGEDNVHFHPKLNI